jgi:hypothetical protein
VVSVIVPDFIYDFFYCDVLNSFLPSCDSNGAPSGNQTPNTANRAPESVEITPVSRQKIDEANYSYVFKFRSEDPDGDEIRYEIDWDNNQFVDQSLPGDTTYITSNVPLETTKLFSSTVAHTFLAKATDSKGASSGWTNFSIQIVNSNLINSNPISASCAISNPTDQRLILPGTDVTWTVLANGGDGNYRYIWNNATTPSAGNTFTHTIANSGSFTPSTNKVVDTSSPQNISDFTCPPATIIPVTCEVDNARPEKDALVNWTVKETSPNYTYQWKFGNTVSQNTTNTVSAKAVFGAFPPTVTVTDTSSTPSKVYRPTCSTISVTDSTINPASILFTAVPNTGTVANPAYTTPGISEINVNINQKFKLSWNIERVFGCTAYSNPSSNVPWATITNSNLSSSVEKQVVASMRYTIRCSGQSGAEVSQSVNVLVNPTGTFQEI